MRQTLRRLGKQWVGKGILAPLYRLCRLLPVDPALVVLADGHQNHMPWSMIALAKELKKLPNVRVVEYFRDYSFCGALKGLYIMLRFIPVYARASYVFVCDCYVPVSCCKKRKETTVVQLWHSGGLMKRIGVDSPLEKTGMPPWLHRNYDVFTTSAGCVSETLAAAMGIAPSVFSQAGVSRTDLLFDDSWADRIRRTFFQQHPQYRGKKIILWAPTFRGSAQQGFLAGQEEILRLQKALPEEYALIIKTHRFAHGSKIDTPVAFGAEELIAVADILITDYSSIYFDFSYFRRPIVLFAPDLEEYSESVGLYRPYESYPGYIARNFEQLYDGVLTAPVWANAAYTRELDRLWSEQMAYCDGHSTKRLLKQLGLTGQEA